MATEKWNSPVKVGFEGADLRTVNGPFDALKCLADFWPNSRGLRYIKARSTCRAALDGRKSVEEARAEFLAAAEEAKLKLH
ncbi:UNVERIFIED_ORG: hypothetical protein GGI57_003355 [Rhizobium aethiopicum]|uniref:Uncharacterized protein n=1 Tax=Rhizobium leguminosarum bv. trifolii TaxID=386 RepID=A0A3E1BTP5_RHILT|nr:MULTISPECIES: DUF982 domain-containing protein [Rhizobium]ANM09052.1 hypothetical protein AMK05_CH00620 [Rhizobium sp. N324]ANM15577.1 hypothetical protein AMK06_CH00635 [Rhizobium sp. N541]ANM21965.1 hypothetical protein AMK07_CH00635 [Rhizobium sp. N941]OHV26989.1 hypothetical protein BBJ66_03065 [Rhizobium sp. RSm-3]OWV78053.1 hypothetical protein ATY75_29005 [Rhizobium sp. N122]